VLDSPAPRQPLPARSEWAIPEEHFDTDRGGLLRYVAARTAEVVRAHGGGTKPVVGFCFSFPVDQTALDNGKVLVWTKVGLGAGNLAGPPAVASRL
jgi:hexokinase